MGSCFSSNYCNSVAPLTAKVISIEGNLREYSVPITVSQVLDFETSPCFLCNSDQLYYDHYVEAIDSDQLLQVGQIYFLLPTSRLLYRLTASDMAALAVKASSALLGRSESKKSKKIRISPVVQVNYKQQRDSVVNGLKRFEKPSMVSVSRSGSVKTLQRNASKRAKTAYRSFRVKLSTIYEGSVLTG